MDEITQLLKTVSLFRDLDDRQLERMAAITRPEIYHADQTIFEQGAAGDKMYIIHQGQVEIQVKDHAGMLNSVLILGEGQIFGEMALLDKGARSASVTAVKDHTVLYAISEPDFRTLCQDNTAIGYLMMRNIARDLSLKIRHQNSFS